MQKHSIIIIVVVLSLISYPALGPAQSARDILRASKVKAKVESLGPGTSVIVDFTNGDTLKGDLGVITDDGFSVADRKTGAATLVSFNEVKTVHKKASHGVLAVEIAAAAGAAVGLLYLTGFALSKCSPCIGR